MNAVFYLFWTGALHAAWLSASFLMLQQAQLYAADGMPQGASEITNDMDRLWKVELKRIKEKLNDGDYNGALVVARVFEKEFENAKKKMSVRDLQGSALLIRQATVHMLLIRAACELYCGNSTAAKSRLTQAESRLLDNKKFGGARYVAILSAWSASKQRSDVGKHLLSQVPIELQANDADRFIAITLQTSLEEWREKQLRRSLDAASSLVYETEKDLILTYDALAAMLIDDSMPVRADSAKSLNDAALFFAKSQKIRETNFQNVSNAFSLHGDQQTTFLRNYGRLFLKQAELKYAQPKWFKDHTTETLLDRAHYYLSQAEESFSEWDKRMRGYQTLVHEGSLSAANQAIQAKLEELKTDRQEAEAFMEDLRLVCIGYADLKFNSSECSLLRARLAAEAGNLDAAREFLDESEQALLNGADMLSLITPKGDHPFLVFTYSGLAAVTAYRIMFLGQEPNEDLSEYLGLADRIMKDRSLKYTTVPGKYLIEAKALAEKVQQDFAKK